MIAHANEADYSERTWHDPAGLSPADFEELTVKLFQAMGYMVEHTGRVGDHGIDLVAHSDVPITGGRLVIQCKRYSQGNNVGEGAVRDLLGAVTHERANKGILLTTSKFTAAATAFASGIQLELIDGMRLQAFLKEYVDRDDAEAPADSSPRHADG